MLQMQSKTFSSIYKVCFMIYTFRQIVIREASLLLILCLRFFMLKILIKKTNSSKEYEYTNTDFIYLRSSDNYRSLQFIK